MRRRELFLAGLLVAGSAAAHGVHDLRGELRREAGRLRIRLPGNAAHPGHGRCLRLLDELQVLDAAGLRLPAERAEDGEPGDCVLDYAIPSPGVELELRLVPSPRRPPSGERLVLDAGEGRALVLTERSNRERLP